MKRNHSTLNNERGSTIVLSALAMTALLAIVALAVDVGMLFTARGEAQRAADAAALAGAGMLISRPGDEDAARAEAIQFGNLNSVRNEGVQVFPEDVIIDLSEDRVTAIVRRTSEQNGGVKTWFANIFGIGEVDVAARATAALFPAGSAACVKPFAIPDRFDDKDGDGRFDPEDVYDAEEHGYGSDFRNDDGSAYEEDFGRPILLKYAAETYDPADSDGDGNLLDLGDGLVDEVGEVLDLLDGDDGTENMGPSWYAPWDMPQPSGPSTGANRYRDNITNCNVSVISVEEEQQVETGNMHGPTVQGVEALIDLDPNAYWDPMSGSVQGSAWDPWEGSPRVSAVAVFDPSRPFEPGKKPIEFTNFIGVFFESVEGNGNDQYILGRVIRPVAVAGGDVVAPRLQAVRLVE